MIGKTLRGEMTATHGRTQRTMRTAWRWGAPALLIVAVAGGIGLMLRPATPVQSAPLAANFALPAAYGARGTVALHALRGHAVLLNFFNSHCAPCIAEMPVLRQTARTYRRHGVIVLGVATGGDTTSSARAFAAAQRLPFTVVADTHQDVAWRYDVGGWPTSFFLDAQGRLRGRYTGPLDAQTVRAGLAQAGTISCAACGHVDVPTTTPPSTTGLSADAILNPVRPAPAFALRDQRGVLITPVRLRSKVVALTFVSAVCTEQCPLVGKGLSQVRRDLRANAARFVIVAISINPEQDSPRAIRHFAALSDWSGADWHYLSAPRRVLVPLFRAYGVYVQNPPPPGGQDIVHQAGLYLIDPRGNLRAYYDVPFLAPRVAASVRALLAS
jgi:cytochrome oxidase Cu insertion factor (SCO1/SenC/PrrC family)